MMMMMVMMVEMMVKTLVGYDETCIYYVVF